MKKTMLLAPIVVLLAIFAMFSPAGAQELATAGVTLPDGEWTVGDPIDIVLTVDHPAGTYVLMPELDQNWDDFVVVSQSPPETVAHPDGSKTTSQHVDARLFAPGEYETPSLTFTVTDENGQLSEVNASSAPITVGSVLVEGDENLRDIKPQANLPVSNFWIFTIAGLLAGALVAGFLYWRRRRAARLALAAVDNRLPHEVALDELDRIEGLRLPLAGAFKEHYALVSDTLRIYVEQAYQVPTLERTTIEIRAGLRQATISTEIARQFVMVLQESDLVKFADITPDQTSAEAVLSKARAVVELSQPIVLSPDDLSGAGVDAAPTKPQFSANGHMPQAEVHA